MVIPSLLIGRSKLFVLVRGHSGSAYTLLGMKEVHVTTNSSTPHYVRVFDYDPIRNRGHIPQNLHTLVSGPKIHTLQVNDIDYTNVTNRAFAIITGSLHNLHYVWVVEGKDECPYSSCQQNLPCCISSTQSDRYTIDFRDVSLYSGRYYKLCAMSNSSAIDTEVGERVVDKVNVCSNGFLVDTTPPTVGKISIGHGSLAARPSSNCLSMKWNGFVDEEEAAFTNDDGIAYYRLSVGNYASIFSDN